MKEFCLIFIALCFCIKPAFAQQSQTKIDTAMQKTYFGWMAFLYDMNQRGNKSLATKYKDWSTAQVLDSLSKYKDALYHGAGSAGGPNSTGIKYQQYFSLLKQIATDDELFELRHHPHAAARWYIFEILHERGRGDLLYPFLLENWNDTTRIVQHKGCVTHRFLVGDHYLKNIAGGFLFDLSEFTFYIDEPVEAILTTQQMQTLDSLVLFSEIDRPYKNIALYNYSPHEKDYNFIRSIALQSNPHAIVALAKFQKDEDLSLINDLLKKAASEIYYLDYFFEAVAHFPHPTFLPFLLDFAQSKEIRNKYHIEYHQYDTRTYFYEALVRYEGNEVNALLQKIIENELDENILQPTELGAALLTYPVYHQNILEQLLASDKEVNLSSLYTTMQEYPELAYELIIQHLDRVSQFKITDDYEKWLFSTIVHFMIKKDKNRFYDAIKDGLIYSKTHHYTNYVEIVKDISFVGILLRKLSERDAFSFKTIIMTIIRYENPAYNQQMIENLHSNQYLSERHKEHLIKYARNSIEAYPSAKNMFKYLGRPY